MRILVTGGGGFIGTHTADALAAAGHEPVLLDAFLPLAHPDYGGERPAHVGDHELVVGDVRDADLLDRLLRGTEAVYHLAAVVGLGADAQDMPLYAGHNELGTAVLLAAMHRAGVGRLILASSVAVYGEGLAACPEHGPMRPLPREAVDLAAGRFPARCPDCGQNLAAQPVPESLEAAPRSMYAVSKLSQEQQAAVWSRLTGGTATCLRYSLVYGPMMPRDTPYSGVAAVFRSMLERGSAPLVYEDGRQVRDFVHVADVAAANLAALRQAPPGWTAYNIGSGAPRSVGELAAVMAASAGGSPPQVTGAWALDRPRDIVIETQLAAAELGFRAATDFRTGIEEFMTAPLRETSAAPNVMTGPGAREPITTS
jgi:dTDP-L-rhamnose 4-epimerase